MKLPLLLLAIWISTTLANLDLTGVPQCALNCTVPGLIKGNCTLTQAGIEHCLCVDTKVEAPISKCVRTRCGYDDILLAKKHQDTLCAAYPIPTRQPELIAQSTILMVAVIIFTALRCWSRYTIFEFWWDDWVFLAAAVILVALQAISIWGDAIGFGIHIWNVRPEHGVALYQYLWIYELLYTLLQLLSKFSIVLLYWRIFPQRWLRSAVILLLVFGILQWLIYTLVILFLCRPIALVFDKTLKGTCMSLNATVLTGAIMTFVQDVIILCLPIPSIWGLHLKTRRKLGVMMILGVGLIATIAAMVRLKFIAHFASSVDQNWDDYGIAIMSSIELSLSILCAAFPTIKPLLNLWFPRWFAPPNENPNPTVSFHMRSTEATGNEKGRWWKDLFASRGRGRSGEVESGTGWSIPWIGSRAPRIETLALGSQIELSESGTSRTDTAAPSLKG